MTLFEINAELKKLLESMVDEETGEINEEAYESYQKMELTQEEKIDSWCYCIKQDKAEMEAAKEVLDKVKERYDAIVNAYEKKKERLAVLMNGEKFKSAYNTIYYHPSDSVVLDDGVDMEMALDPKYLSYGKPRLNSTAIKKALADGEKIAGVHMEHHETMVIK